ncbi:MAG: response regulator [Phycisphaerales bacterium]
MAEKRPKLLVLDSAVRPGSAVADALARSFDLEFPDPNTPGRMQPNGEVDLVLAPAKPLSPPPGKVGQDRQAHLVLSSLGEGICFCDDEGLVIWANPKYDQFPEEVRSRVERTCRDAARLFADQVDSEAESGRKYGFQLGEKEKQYFELIVSPVVDPDCEDETESALRVVAMVWDNTRRWRLQQKLDAIDQAGNELVRFQSDAIALLNTAQRLALLEDKIIAYTRDLMHFDHFNIYLLDKTTNRLTPVMNVGMPEEVNEYELYGSTTGSGISGYVAATGKSYICQDVQNDGRYLPGLENAASSLSVPLRLRDEVIGVFNIESKQPAAFTEEDRQFAEIFGRYVALALNILDLLVVERCTTSGAVAVNVIGEISHPLNDITAEANLLRDRLLKDPDSLEHLDHIISLVSTVRRKVQEVAKGPRSILGAHEAIENAEIDPVLAGRHILVADDEPNIRDTIENVLCKRGARVTVCASGVDAIELFEGPDPVEFDLILSDISMPDRNGYEVFAAARKMSDTIPVILMTGFGYDPHHSIVRASQEGLQCVLFKPFQVEQLLEEVTKALEAHVARNSAT